PFMPFVKTDFSISLGELKHHFTPSRRQEPGGDIFRPVCFKCRVFDGPPGSAYAEFGGTKVLARVYGPIDDPNGYSNAASLSVKMKGLSNTTRIASQVLSVVKTCVMVHKYSQCLFDIEVTVLNDEGGLLQSAHVARSSSGDWIVDPTSEQIVGGCSECTLAVMPNQNQIVCCDLRGSHLTSSQVDEFITYATEKAMKLYPVLRKALLNTLPEKDESSC
ncbi:hypothetical protein V3C99_010427, partial [Haemonchus contortus]|uniref:RNase_PH domain-containing protein n=1 Tax=Haemonchus contortus TaxID=6289 RepID=A0A7I5EA09_HAECO